MCKGNSTSRCIYSKEHLFCHYGSPGYKKTTEAGEASITAVEETTNSVLIITGFIGFDLWYAILSLKLIKSNMETFYRN